MNSVSPSATKIKLQKMYTTQSCTIQLDLSRTAAKEKLLRRMTKSNSNIRYLNVTTIGLQGRQHPALRNLHTRTDFERSLPDLKMLSVDYWTYEKKLSNRVATIFAGFPFQLFKNHQIYDR